MDAHDDEPTFVCRMPFSNRQTSRLIVIHGYLPGPGEPDYAQFDKLLWFLVELERNHSGNPITLVIDSPGGNTDALEIVLDHIGLMACPVWTVARNVSSAAALLFAAGAKGHRYVFNHSQIVLHLAGYAPCRCPRHDIELEEPVIEAELAKSLVQLNLRIARLLDECTAGKILNILGIRSEESDEEERANGILTLLSNTITLDAKGAKKYGLADHIIGEEEFRALFFR